MTHLRKASNSQSKGLENLVREWEPLSARGGGIKGCGERREHGTRDNVDLTRRIVGKSCSHDARGHFSVRKGERREDGRCGGGRIDIGVRLPITMIPWNDVQSPVNHARAYARVERCIYYHQPGNSRSSKVAR